MDEAGLQSVISDLEYAIERNLGTQVVLDVLAPLKEGDSPVVKAAPDHLAVIVDSDELVRIDFVRKPIVKRTSVCTRSPAGIDRVKSTNPRHFKVPDDLGPRVLMALRRIKRVDESSNIKPKLVYLGGKHELQFQGTTEHGFPTTSAKCALPICQAFESKNWPVSINASEIEVVKGLSPSRIEQRLKSLNGSLQRIEFSVTGKDKHTAKIMWRHKI